MTSIDGEENDYFGKQLKMILEKEPVLQGFTKMLYLRPS